MEVYLMMVWDIIRMVDANVRNAQTLRKHHPAETITIDCYTRRRSTHPLNHRYRQ